MHLPVLITTSRLNISRQLPIIKVFVLIFNLILMQLFSFELKYKKTITDSGNPLEYNLKPLSQTIQRKITASKLD
jgi:hypothetical protein